MHKRFIKYLKNVSIIEHVYCAADVPDMERKLYNAWQAGRRYGKMYEHDSYCRTRQDGLIIAVREEIRDATKQKISDAWDELYAEAEEKLDE